MNQFIFTAALVALGSLTFVTESNADHKQTVRREYEVQRVNLDNDYRARREANKYAYHRERDLLRAERARAFRIDCPETRAQRVRLINRELAASSRAYHLNKREIAARYHDEKASLRTSYEFARRDARRPVVVSYPVVTERVITAPVYPHPADCECNICVPSAPVPVETLSLPCEEEFRRAVPTYDDYNYRPANFGREHHGRSSRTVDWASLLIGLLAN